MKQRTRKTSTKYESIDQHYLSLIISNKIETLHFPGGLQVPVDQYLHAILSKPKVQKMQRRK